MSVEVSPAHEWIAEVDAIECGPCEGGSNSMLLSLRPFGQKQRVSGDTLQIFEGGAVEMRVLWDDPTTLRIEFSKCKKSASAKQQTRGRVEVIYDFGS